MSDAPTSLDHETLPAPGSDIGRSGWLVGSGREDHRDTVSDEFEPRPESGREQFWSRRTPGWPTRAAS